MKKFINGMLAEKAKIANTLMSELMAEMPDTLLEKYHESLEVGSTACHNLYSDLRSATDSVETRMSMSWMMTAPKPARESADVGEVDASDKTTTSITKSASMVVIEDLTRKVFPKDFEREGCDEFTRILPGDCDGDGHYMCRVCKYWSKNE